MACPEQITSQLPLDQLSPQPWPPKAMWSQQCMHTLWNTDMRTHPHECTHSHKAAAAYPEVLQLLFLEGIHGLCQVVGRTVSVHRGPLCTGLRLASGSQEVETVTGWSWHPDTYYSRLFPGFWGSFSCLLGSLANLVSGETIRQDYGERLVTSRTDLLHSCVTSDVT